jgi:hypothetical protein
MVRCGPPQADFCPPRKMEVENTKMRPVCLWISMFLLLVPCVRADTLQVDYGFIQTYGGTGQAPTAFLSGNGFTATGAIIFTGACPQQVLAGSAFTGCAGFDWMSGQLTLDMNGVSRQLQFGNNFGVSISQAAMFVSGQTGLTVSEAATMTSISACPNAAADPGSPLCPITTFLLPQDIFFSASLLPNLPDGSGVQTYTVQSERYAFSEPDMFVLFVSGVAVVLPCLKRKVPFRNLASRFKSSESHRR